MTAAPAFAADLAVKAPPPVVVPVVFSWTGCYVGGHVGGAVSADRQTGVLGNSAGFSSAGFVGGGQAGCDYQFATGWVAGLEGQGSWSSLNRSHRNSVVFFLPGSTVRVPSQFTFGNDFLASATARLGYSFADRRLLVFLRGGGAWTGEKLDDAFVNLGGIAVDPRASVTRTGWIVGTGAEWAFAPHWSATLEYNYYDFGKNSALLTGDVTRVTFSSLKDTIHAVTAGVNYRF
jgi:outer membrane immunogenic protein